MTYGDWQPFDTAPQDGNPFLGCTMLGDIVIVAYDPIADRWTRSDGVAFNRAMFKGWTPLPEPMK